MSNWSVSTRLGFHFSIMWSWRWNEEEGHHAWTPGPAGFQFKRASLNTRPFVISETSQLFCFPFMESGLDDEKHAWAISTLRILGTNSTQRHTSYQVQCTFTSERCLSSQSDVSFWGGICHPFSVWHVFMVHPAPYKSKLNDERMQDRG